MAGLTEPRRVERFLRQIHDISVSTAGGFRNEVGRLLELGREEFQLAAGAVSSAGPEQMTILYAAGSDRLQRGAVIDVCDSFCAEVTRLGQPILVSDAARSEWAAHPCHTKIGLSAYLGAPIEVGSGRLGTVCFADWDPRKPFDADDRDLLGLLAQRVESALRRVEEADALRESEERFHTAFEHAAVGIAHIAVDGAWLRPNPRLCEMLGYDGEELRGRSVEELAYAADLGPFRERLVETLAGRTPGYAVRLRLRREDGRLIDTRVTARLLRDAWGRPKYFVAVFDDRAVGDRSEAAAPPREERIREAQKLESLGSLAGGIAHDFNNLLTAILGNASLAAKLAPHGSPLRTSLSQVERAAYRASDLTHQLLAYAGRSRGEVVSVDLGELVDEMRELLYTAVAKRVRPRWVRPTEPSIVRGDATDLRQIVMNLAINAAEALEGQGSTVSIAVEPRVVEAVPTDDEWIVAPVPGRYVALTMADDGSGMDAGTRRRMFEPFFSRKVSGRGLGLAAVLEIVNGLQGAIRVVSQPRQGTTVTVLLPQAAEAVDAAVTPRPADEAYPGHGRALVVDDEPHVRLVVTTMLEGLGFEVRVASHGEEAVRAVEREGERLRWVLLDYTMPGMSGAEAFRRIRELRPQLPVVLMSGFNREALAALLADSKSSGFLQKPFDVAGLSAALRTLLDDV